MKSVLKTLLASTIALPLLTVGANAQTSLTVMADHDFSGATPAGGTLEGDASISGGVLNLDGDGDYLSFASAPLTATDDYVVEAIFNASAFDGFDSIVYNGNTNNSGGQGLLQEGGSLDGIVMGISLQGTSVAATTGSSVALALVRESGVSTVYVDGVAQTTAGATLAPASAASVLNIGAGISGGGAPEGFFAGTIDRARLSTINGTFDPADLLGPGDGTAPVGQVFLSNAEVDDFSITETAADASVELSGAAADVTLFWSTTDYGTELVDWQTNGSSDIPANQSIGTVNRSLSGLTVDTPYFVRFYAVNSVPDPDQKAWSDAVTFGTPFATGQKVTDLTASAIAYDQIDLTWSDAFNTETEYYIERSTDGVIWDPLTTLPADTTSHSDTGLAGLTLYKYRILGANIVSGDSDWSDEAADTTPAEPPFTTVDTYDYTFDDNQKPENFTEYGDPTYADGKLLLDGDGDYIQLDPAPTTATDNVIFEAIASASSVGTFNFVASISSADGSNSGYGLIAQGGEWRVITSAAGYPGVTPHGPTPTPAVALAYVREKGNTSLYVDGVQYDGAPDTTPFFNDAGLITIGGHPFDIPNGLFNGSIDRIRVTTFTGPFDSTYLLSAPAAGDTFDDWITTNYPSLTDKTFTGDDDDDGLGNGLENFFGTDPDVWNAGLAEVSTNGTTTLFEHPQNDSPASDVVGSYEWSLDAETWYDGDGIDGPGGGLTVNIPTVTPAGGTAAVTATSSQALDRLFVRAKATQTM